MQQRHYRLQQRRQQQHQLREHHPPEANPQDLHLPLRKRIDDAANVPEPMSVHHITHDRRIVLATAIPQRQRHHRIMRIHRHSQSPNDDTLHRIRNRNGLQQTIGLRQHTKASILLHIRFHLCHHFLHHIIATHAPNDRTIKPKNGSQSNTRLDPLLCN